LASPLTKYSSINGLTFLSGFSINSNLVNLFSNDVGLDDAATSLALA